MKFEVIDSNKVKHRYGDEYFYEVDRDGIHTSVAVKRERDVIELIAVFFNPSALLIEGDEDQDTTAAAQFLELPHGYRCERCGFMHQRLRSHESAV